MQIDPYNPKRNARRLQKQRGATGCVADSIDMPMEPSTIPEFRKSNKEGVIVTLYVGALCFGIVVGWVTSRTLRRSQSTGLSDIATVIGAVGGAAITGLFKSETDAFSYYCIGLFVGFFVYLIIAISIAKSEGNHGIGDWLGSEPVASGSGHVNPQVPPPAPLARG